MTRRDSWYRSVASALVVASCFACHTASRAERLSTVPAVSTSQGVATLEHAARDGKYLFIYFWKQNDQQTQSMYRVFQNATSNMSQAAEAISVNITDPHERPLVDRFDVSRAPMPLALAVAPNGAVTKGVPLSFSEQELREAIVSRGTAACLKLLQGRKLVLLCVQDQTAPKDFLGVRQFVEDPRFAASAEIVTVDGADQSEAALLRSLQVDPRRDLGITVLLAPPGQTAAKFASTVTKDEIIARVTASSSGCCPGGSCGPGGQCGPAQQCAPGQRCAPGQQCGPNGCAPR